MVVDQFPKVSVVLLIVTPPVGLTDPPANVATRDPKNTRFQQCAFLDA
jgi:hypothetical protein